MREIHRRLRDLYFKEGWSTAAAAKCGGCSAAWVKTRGGRKRGGGRFCVVGNLEVSGKDERVAIGIGVNHAHEHRKGSGDAGIVRRMGAGLEDA